jgi:pimeloyl-ACP methyl ester carboxylesterase
MRRPSKKAVAATLAGAPFAWLAWSRLGIDHHRPLPPAIDAERRVFASPSAGLLSYYVDEGPRELAGERPLVLLHSINAAASAAEMRPLFEQFRGRRRLYAPDLPGYGFSDRSDRVYTPALFATAIAEFLADVAAGTDGADVIALSLTAEFAAAVALRHPSLVHSLVLISPTGLNREPNALQRVSPERSKRIHGRLASPVWAQGLFDLLVSRPSVRFFLAEQFEGPPDPFLVSYAWTTAHQPGARYAPFWFLSGALFTPDIRPAVYAALEQQVLVLYDRSPNVTFDALPDLLTTRPNWTAHRIAPTRGLPHFERLGETADAIADFWDEPRFTAPRAQSPEEAPRAGDR